MRRIIVFILELPTRRPLTVLAVAGILVALAVVGTFNLHPDNSLDAMFPENDPSAKAMLTVLDRFGTTDELQILVTLPGGADQADPDRLEAFGQRFTAAAGASAEAKELFDAVEYRVDPDATKFFKEELGPAAMYYLDDADFAAARQRLTPQAMREALRHDQAVLGQPGPVGGAMSQALMQDPLGLHDFLLPKLATAQPMRTYQNGESLISPDGRALLIRVLAKKPPTDMEYARRICRLTEAITQQANPGGLRVVFTGAYEIADTAARSVRRDSIDSIIGSILLLLMLFIAAYRKPIRFFHLAFLPVAIGVLWGFGAYAMTFRDLSPIAAVIGGVLAGMGIDYSVLYLTRVESLRASGLDVTESARQTILPIGPAIFAAWATSVAGFLAIGWSSVRALKDLSILGTLGLTGSFLAAMLVLPAIVILLGKDQRQSHESGFRFDIGPLLSWVRRHRSVWVGMCAGILAMSLFTSALYPQKLLQPEPDLTVMHPRPNPPLDAEEELSSRFGLAPGSMLVYLHAQSPEELVRLAHRVHDRLTDPAVAQAGITGSYGLDVWLPDPDALTRRRSQIDPDEADRVATDFRAALADSPFDSAAFASYGTFIHDLISHDTIPTLSTLEQYPGLARNLLPRDNRALPTEAVTLIWLSRRTEDRAGRDAAIAAVNHALKNVPGATLSGLAVVGRDAELEVRTDLPKLLTVAAVLNVVFLLVYFRSATDMFLSLLPAIFGLAGLSAFIILWGVHLNMVNLVAAPLLIGIDVDYGIYLVTLGRRKDSNALAAPGYAVLVCASSMIAGYASLWFTSVPAVQSLGMVVSAGVVLCLAGTFLFLAPVLLSAEQNRI